MIIPIPDTSRSAALQLSYDLGVKYQEGFIKNRYIGRTFIMPGQTQRKKSVRQKLNAINIEFKDKVVLLVDDSIVRGTTSQQIVQMAREAGAKKVYFASAAPPVRYPNVYGIDMPSPKEFVAHDRNIDQIADELGVDWLIYQELDDLIDAVNEAVDATGCGGSEDCQAGNMCLTHHLWTDLSNQIHFFLSGISLADLVSQGEAHEHEDVQRQIDKTNATEFLNFVSE